MEVVEDLRCDYTYDIIESDPKKRDSRKMIGKMAADLLEKMSEEIITAGHKMWGEYEATRDNSKGSDSVIEVSQTASVQT